jgi:hypothetical protein
MAPGVSERARRSSRRRRKYRCPPPRPQRSLFAEMPNLPPELLEYDPPIEPQVKPINRVGTTMTKEQRVKQAKAQMKYLQYVFNHSKDDGLSRFDSTKQPPLRALPDYEFGIPGAGED